MVDLKERNIKMSDLSPENSVIQELFLDILEEAYIQQGFEVEGYQLFVEAKPLPNYGFHISITKFEDGEELEGDYSSGYFINEIGDFYSHSIDHEMKSELVYSFTSIDSIQPCMKVLNKYSFAETNLFQLEDKYVLSLWDLDFDQDILSIVHAYLLEHGEKEYFSIAYLKEHGKPIIENNALENLNKYYKAGY